MKKFTVAAAIMMLLGTFASKAMATMTLPRVSAEMLLPLERSVARRPMIFARKGIDIDLHVSGVMRVARSVRAAVAALFRARIVARIFMILASAGIELRADD